MKYHTTTVREGEFLGPIDYTHDFLQYFQGYCSGPEYKQERCDKCVSILRQIEPEPHLWEVNVRGYWHPLYSVGMYDGWPFWKPTPAMLTGGVLCAEHHFFYDLLGCRKLRC
jgi:hypothetical protein